MAPSSDAIPDRVRPFLHVRFEPQPALRRPGVESRVLLRDAMSTGESEGSCHTEHTAVFEGRVADRAGGTDRQMILIWDGATWHRAGRPKEMAARRGKVLMGQLGPEPDRGFVEMEA